MPLPVAYRSLSRPSSAPDAKAFPLRSFLLDLVVVAKSASLRFRLAPKTAFRFLAPPLSIQTRLRWALNRGAGDTRDYSKLGSQIIILRIMQAFFEMSFFEIVLECVSILYPMHFSMHQIVPQLLFKSACARNLFRVFHATSLLPCLSSYFHYSVFKVQKSSKEDLRRRKVRFTPFPAKAENCVPLPCSSSFDSNPLRWASNRGAGGSSGFLKTRCKHSIP